MSLESNAAPIFAGHQTFHPRFGWLKKGLDACREDPDVFNAPDAPLRLGVGKNMVEAIRFWSQATRITTRVKNPERKRTYLTVPTVLGERLLNDRGLDPYFEHPGTLWVLHWQAVSAPSMLPVWWCAFNDLQALEFDADQLQRLCEDEIAASTWSSPNPSSVKKDVECLLRMYSRRAATGRQTLDDLMDSPFRELGLIVPSPGARDSFRFTRGAKASLPSAVIAYSALDYLARSNLNAGTLSVSRLATDDGSPGRILKLTEDALTSALEQHLDLEVYQIASPGGAPQVVLQLPAEEAATEVLISYYASEGSKGTVRGTLAGEGARAPAVASSGDSSGVATVRSEGSVA